MTQKEFEELWLPAIQLLARSQVYLQQIDKNNPTSYLVDKLIGDINKFIRTSVTHDSD